MRIREPETNLPVHQVLTGLSRQAVEFAMNKAARLRELEAECRQRAESEFEKKWYWLAQAAKYQIQANQKIAFQSEECNTADSPEVKLAQWKHGRDQRRLMEPLLGEGRMG